MRKKLQEILRKFGGDKEAFDIFVPEHESFGHYSTNLAMRLAKKEKKNPVDLAGELAAKIQESSEQGFLEKVEAAAPGFVNFWFSKKAIVEELAGVYRNLKKYGRSDSGKGKTIIVEYSQPNIAKKMHVGHLRTTIIGDALANIFEFLGYKVVRWNYLGDWGTQFGKLIAAYKLWGSKEKVESNPIDELQALYVRFHEELKRDPKLEKRGQEEFKKLEEGDKENRKLWEWFKKESLREFENMYKVLGVKFDTYIGESFYEKEVPSLVGRLLKAGIAEESEGAVVINLERFGLPPALIRKSDGASLYLVRDIANLEYRIRKYSPEKILYVVGNEQSLHFEQLFAVKEVLGIEGADVEHVKFGLVLGEKGKKLATREGRTILLEEAIDKATKLSREVVEQKNPDLSDEEKDVVSEAVGIGALKYHDLKENRNSDIVFDWDRMLDLGGDSGPYLQYTYARLRSIQRKVSGSGKPNFSSLEKDPELNLIRKIVEFPNEVARSVENLATSNLANYLHKLAILANRMYETTPVMKEEDDSRRAALIVLIDTTASVLSSGLGLLGIKTPEKI